MNDESIFVYSSCCPVKIVYLAVRPKGNISADDKPYWAVMKRCKGPLGNSSTQEVEANFCPACGKSLPNIVRNPNPPEKMVKVTDGGYYCDTCNERLGVCSCSPPWMAWMPEKPI